MPIAYRYALTAGLLALFACAGLGQGDDGMLRDLQVSEGPPSAGFMMSALAGQLPEGDVAPAPAFHPGVTSYAADVEQGVVTLRLQAASGTTMEVAGTTASGTELLTGSQSSVDGDNGAFMSVTFSDLLAGENTIEIVLTAEDETTTETYTLVVTSAAAPAPIVVLLKDIQLSEGPPSSGFMMSALAGQLPEGDLVPAPAFDPGVNTYTADVAQDVLTIRLRAPSGISLEVTGTAADGAGLSSSDRSQVNGADAFASQTLSGLTPGENTIEIVLTAEDVPTTQTYTLVVTYSDGG